MPTHTRTLHDGGRILTENGCSTAVAVSGHNADRTRLILIHAYDDPKDDDNLRVYCLPCADEHQRATSNDLDVLDAIGKGNEANGSTTSASPESPK
ncbi:MAG: hypothetical protein ABSE64_04170 [Vulcanimicrobiaceae bacterium]